MDFNLWERVNPSENELLVKSFQCSKVGSFIKGLKTNGYLSVTNKRVVFTASDNNTAIQNEVPLEDVSGVSFYRGSYFSLLHFIAYGIILILIGLVISSLMITIGGEASMVLSLIAAFGTLVGAIAYLSQKKTSTFAFPLLAKLSAQFFFCAATGSAFAALTSSMGMGFMGFNGGIQIVWIVFGLLAYIFFLYTFVKFCIRPAFSFIVSSRGSGNSPIRVTGLKQAASGNLVSRTIVTEPAEDSDALMRNLSAMIMDLQKLGDHAIAKWQH